ncbi:pectate lyase [Hymenobacter sp. DH14]|uniref:Pectate lyase n=1 Tax=Hymenobacter cyanobacteriorum TaxID=2926463 RepID=A0A9X1VHT0_9BACT|nr:pectate lyase [Hymenobacter cyanobacteriorum]MCI1189121.1 pectate lyase [Hymenobacter cyanobacteriorum]
MKLPLLLLLLATGLSEVGLSPTLPPATPERGAGNLAAGRVPQAAPLTDSTADKMLVFQRSIGGWPKAVGSKKVDYKHPLNAAERVATLADKGRTDATIDNNATTREIAYLAKAYQTTNNAAYRQAAETGIRYLLKMQYANGGFPQYYPDFSNYRHQITYNDNAMVRALEVLRDVAKQKAPYVGLDAALALQAQAAVARGVQCMLKTQYVRGGHPTAWCAQYDEKTLQPAKARAFELASLSGDESVDIVRFLMGIEQPSAAEKQAVECAIDWFQKVKLTNTTVQEVTDPQTHKVLDRKLVPQAGATVWARFYELNTDRPIFVGRDSQVHYQLADIEIERRAGYLYAGTWPEKLLTKDFPAWQKRLSAAHK